MSDTQHIEALVAEAKEAIREAMSESESVGHQPGSAAAGPRADEARAAAEAAIDSLASLARQQQAEPAPIDMVLHCPKCGKQHIDKPDPWGDPDYLIPMDEYERGRLHHQWVAGAPEWKCRGSFWCERRGDHMGIWLFCTHEGRWNNPPHRSHKCHGCGHIWRPADVQTNGVEAVKTKGKNDSPIASQAERQEMQVLELTPYFCGYARIQDGEYKLAGMHTTEVMNDGEVHPLYAFPNELIEALHAVPATQEQLKPFNGMTKVQAREWLETISSTSESAALCACKERPAFQCPGEWEPGCDLGNNEKYVDVSRQQTK